MKDKKMKIFFSGIGGSGVSAIASFMVDQGHTVVGSDRSFDINPDNEIKKLFLSKGITLVPQDGSGIDASLDFAVFSTAVEPAHPEMIKAMHLDIQCKTRPEYLAEITSSFETIAVSGTSGKSTAAGLLAFLMKRLGLNPNFIGGGRVKQFRNSKNSGNSLYGTSNYLIIEACESDGTIINYRPAYTIILNIAFDHHSVDDTKDMFKQLMKNTDRRVFINADDNRLTRIRDEKSCSFSLHNNSSLKAIDINLGPLSTDFTINKTHFSLSLPGRHNLYNALSCIALLSEIGITLDDIAKILPEFRGIERRFDIHLNNGTNLVIDDYAHNPHKIFSLMQTVKPLSDNICYIFQPHGFGPTRLMKTDYIEVFANNLRDSDYLILLPIYYAGGTTQRDISSHDLAREIQGKNKNVEVIEKREDVFERVKRYKTCVVFGARDESLSNFAKQIATLMEQG